MRDYAALFDEYYKRATTYDMLTSDTPETLRLICYYLYKAMQCYLLAKCNINTDPEPYISEILRKTSIEDDTIVEFMEHINNVLVNAMVRPGYDIELVKATKDSLMQMLHVSQGAIPMELAIPGQSPMLFGLFKHGDDITYNGIYYGG